MQTGIHIRWPALTGTFSPRPAGRRFALGSLQAIALCVLFVVFVDNYTFWSSLFAVVDLTNPGMILLVLASFGIIFSVTYGFLALFGVARAVRPLMAFLLIVASVVSYYMDAYRAVFDDVMMLNILETNLHEATELLDMKMLVHVVLTGILPVLVLYRLHIRYRPFRKELVTRLLVVAGMVCVTGVLVYSSYRDFTFVFRENREIGFFVNPAYPLRSVYRLLAREVEKSRRRFVAVFNDAHRLQPPAGMSDKKPDVLVIVVGETARAQNFHLNGYGRNTTPRLEQHPVINFRNVTACGTATAISLPCMFSDLVHNGFDNNAARSRQNLLDALKIAGLQVLWRENNPDCKGVCDRIETDDVSTLHLDAYCHNGQCFDEVLFNGLDSYLGRLQGDAVIVLHAQGSHGPAYYRRYPESFKKFLPECRSSTVQDCSDTEVSNAYDNTILYTDYFLAKVIDYLQARSEYLHAAMLYISDHGESLGEYGVYLHGLPWFLAPDYQKKVPMIFWSSRGFADDRALDTACLARKVDTELSHDNLLHSVLGLMDVASQHYNRELDIFDSCRHAAVVKAGVQDNTG